MYFFLVLTLWFIRGKGPLTNPEFDQEVSKAWSRIVSAKDQTRILPERFNLNFSTLIYLCLITWLNLSCIIQLNYEIFMWQISRSIGDVYLKKAEFNKEPLYAKFRVREGFKRPILSSDPSISVHEIQQHDQFLIFASDGLWEHLSNQDAVDIVQNNPHNVR